MNDNDKAPVKNVPQSCYNTAHYSNIAIANL